ncbi:MAG: hydrogenase isoenzyme formation protein HypD [Bacillales bacterium]|jgi:hydrogenase expression/formation protein HypD|nr:hydrogenase isoenzyme formation protein HypD [Bacillales bacterium]
MQETLNRLSDKKLSVEILNEVICEAKKFKEKHGRKPAIMEVCGSHTMSLARTGLKRVLKDHINLISGPGCPVCVTDQQSIDSMIELSNGDNRIICTFGDMIRIPGSKKSLFEAKTEGKDIRVLYSPTDSIRIAEENPDKEVIFLGIGFETTIPILGVVIKLAEEKNLNNFSMWVSTKLVEPILRALLDSGEVMLDGFLLPGHVSIVLGEDQYSYIVDDYGISSVISGFEPVEMARGLFKLLNLLNNNEKSIINDHKCMVSKSGNLHAQNILKTYFEEVDEAWRGIGVIPKSGLDIREEYKKFNAKYKFNITIGEVRKTKCKCGEILKGLATPEDCPVFGKGCTPANPIGPCMVSSEGTCAAHYQYMRELY